MNTNHKNGKNTEVDRKQTHVYLQPEIRKMVIEEMEKLGITNRSFYQRQIVLQHFNKPNIFSRWNREEEE